MQQQLSWRNVLTYLGGAILIIFVLRLSGVIGDFWAGIGILAVIFLFATTAFLPSYRTLADVLLFIWISMAFLGPYIWSQLPPPIRNAWVMKKGAAIIRGSELLTHYGVEAEKVRHLYCAQEEDRLTKREILPLKQKLDAMAKVNPELNDPKRLVLELSLRKKEEGIKAWRERCAEGNKPSLPTTNVAWWWLVAPLLLFGYGLYRANLQSPWTRWVGGAMLISAILLAGYWLFFIGGVEQAEGKVKGFLGGTPAPAAPRVERPAYEVLEDGTIALEPGTQYRVGGTETIAFRMPKEGFYLLDGRVQISSSVLFTLVSGERTRDFELDAESHARQYGGPPCFRDANPFKMSVISATGQPALLRARLPGEKCD